MKKFLQKNDKSFIILLIALFGIMPIRAWASNVDLRFDKKTIDIGEKVTLSVKLSADEYINAIALTLNFPEDILEVENISTGNSIIAAWIEPPKMISNGEIKISGIVPGGFVGENGQLFSVNFRSRDKGMVSIYLSGVEGLKNDGLGSNAYIKINPIQLTVNNWVFQGNDEKIMDIDKPEDFKPEINRDKSLFNNKWFVVFQAQDKKTGVNSYEILEYRPNQWLKTSWEKVESPYVLRDQTLKSTVLIKAIDFAGNERIVKIESMNKITFLDNWFNWLLILLIVIYVFYRFKTSKK